MPEASTADVVLVSGPISTSMVPGSLSPMYRRETRPLAFSRISKSFSTSIVRTEGKEGLFEDRRYGKVFPTRDLIYYLTRYWLMREVGYAAQGYPERAYAKWLVLHFMWKHMAPLIQKRAMGNAFIMMRLNENPSIYPLDDAINSAFAASIRFYRRNRGKGARAVDLSTFFMRRGLDKAFERFWRSPVNGSRRAFQRKWFRFERDLREEAGV